MSETPDIIRIHDLRPAPGAKTAKKRVGRGEGGKGGKTAGRGTKGQGARGQQGPRAPRGEPQPWGSILEGVIHLMSSFSVMVPETVVFLASMHTSPNFLSTSLFTM